jgi:hypothetical protein
VPIFSSKDYILKESSVCGLLQELMERTRNTEGRVLGQVSDSQFPHL